MKILVVDDEEHIVEVVCDRLAKLGHTGVGANNVHQAASLLRSRAFDGVLTDIKMPGPSGLDLLHWMRTHGFASMPVILVSGFLDLTAEQAFSLGAIDLFVKPFKVEAVMQSFVRVAKGIPATTDQQPSLVIEVQVRDDQLFTAASGVVLGRGGIFVEYAATLPAVGSIIELHGKKSREDHLVFSCIGRVRWIRQMGAVGHRPGFGLEFLAIPQQFREVAALARRELQPVEYIPSAAA